MVRTALLVLFSQRALADSSLMQTHSQNEHILDAFHAGSNRVKKMQENTQAMEAQYKGLLEKIVQAKSLSDPETGEPFLPGKGFFETVKKQFESLTDQLQDEKKTNNEIVAQKHKELRDLNVKLEEDIGKLVASNGKLTVVRGLREQHGSCRGDEDGLIGTMEASCAEFEGLGNHCSDNQDWYAQYDDSYIADTESVPLKTVVAKAETCQNDIALVDEKAKECDGLQKQFSVAYCHYSNSLGALCDSYDGVDENTDGDYQRTVKELQDTVKSVKTLEGEQKIIFRMVQRVLCYVNKLETASETENRLDLPTDKDITECMGKNYESLADGELTITYNDVSSCKSDDTTCTGVQYAPKSLCWARTRSGVTNIDTLSAQYNAQLVAGASANDYTTNDYRGPNGASDGWYSDEFDSYKKHDKLRGPGEDMCK